MKPAKTNWFKPSLSCLRDMAGFFTITHLWPADFSFPKALFILSVCAANCWPPFPAPGKNLRHYLSRESYSRYHLWLLAGWQRFLYTSGFRRWRPSPMYLPSFLIPLAPEGGSRGYNLFKRKAAFWPLPLSYAEFMV